MAARQTQLQKIADTCWSKAQKISAELFTLTYGAIVWQMIKDNENLDDVNSQLEKMGYNMGLRLIDEFLSRSGLGRCRDFKETADVVAKVAFKMFLGSNVTVKDSTEKEFTLVLEDNPLTDFCELPEQYKKTLHYCNILCGVIRGALEMVQLRVECQLVKCILRGDEATEIKVVFKELLKDEIPTGDD
eukprot:TRINITY_DN6320_c0_g1_i1.p1 TRINITY_DN6320_c0_g1~~TRINITY_DN6320_c0_g1_i1.p1  ORF type:complete len:209 (+),score=40.69 TRINITY_DN6320_c0_g1_i1:64-627(+)